MSEINKRQRLVFVYGSLKSGFQLNPMLVASGAKLVGSACIVSRTFVMRSLGAFPALQRVEPGSGDVIHGELWLTTNEGIQTLDRVESYPSLYNRDQVKVHSDGKCYDAIVYFMDGSVHHHIWLKPIIKSGKWEGGMISDSEFGFARVDSDHGDEIIPWEGESYDGYTLQEETDEDVLDAEFTVSEDDPTSSPLASFFVEDGIYITTNDGEHYGPYESVKQAVDDVSNLAEDIVDFDIKTFTIGFRIIREDLDKDELADIDGNTSMPF